MVKSSICELQKGVWKEDGDAKMGAALASKQRGTGNWSRSSKRSGAGQRRSGKMCRERWSSNEKGDPSFTPQEEELIIQLHAVIGSRWTIIAQQLAEKTESEVKIVWNSKLKKKLSAMGIDPVTHKPFSQILADYGSIPCRPRQTAAPPVKAENEGSASTQDFSWTDFFLEDAFAAAHGDDISQVTTKIEGVGFDAASASSSSSAFVDAMIGKQDEMCSHLPCFYEEPFYY